MRSVSQDLSTTSYALLGLLVFDGSPSPGMTGYEVKQRADKTLRFYWVSPAMSQVYTELERLARFGLASATSEVPGQRRARRYKITALGQQRLEQWLAQPEVDFPTLKHPVALRLLMSGLVGPERARALLEGYLDQLASRRADLLQVRGSLGEAESLRYPAMVADWGLDYYDSEARMVHELLVRLWPAGTAATGPGPTDPGTTDLGQSAGPVSPG
jgi:DNA-binding PadR family transcriptional regulator